MSKQKNVVNNATETKQERFRRIANQRLKPIKKYALMLEKMPQQPSYDISEHDAKVIVSEISNTVAPVIEQFEKLARGERRTKEVKELQSIDWDKELIDE